MLDNIPAEVQLVFWGLVIMILTLMAKTLGRVSARLLNVFEVKFNAWLDLKLSKDQQELLTKLAKEAQLAAEQMYKDLDGPAKFEAAKNHLIEQANGHNIPVTEEKLKALLEAAVAEFNNERDRLKSQPSV